MILTPQQSRGRYAYAIVKGVIKNGDSCAICGIHKSKLVKGGMAEHHEDYQKPLEAITLCCSCHTKLHILKRRGLDHPDMTSRAIGKIFHISHVRVLAILKAKQ